MPSDYKAIANKNISKYGTAIDNYGPVLLAHLYSDRTHFVYELLQNAEDALSERFARNRKANIPCGVHFDLFRDHLEFRHFGLEFNDEDVHGICGLVEGTKADDLTSIGKFGIGFKSVYAYSHHPEIHSGPEHFVIESFVRPQQTSPRMVGAVETMFYLPFDNPDISSEKAFSEISDRLKKLELRTLLFLRYTDEIHWTIDGVGSGRYLRKSSRQDSRSRYVTLSETASDQGSFEKWLVFERPLPGHGAKTNISVEIAYRIERDQKTRRNKIASITDSTLVVYFPTEKETHVGFLVQGPFRTTPSRDNIPKDDDWNRTLVKEIAILLHDTLTHLRDKNMLTASVLESMPLEVQHFNEDNMFSPLFEMARRCFSNEKLIPRHGGGFVAGKNARLARGTGLRELLSPSQLQMLYESENSLNWISDEISEDRTPQLRDYLVEQLDIEEVTPSDIASHLAGRFVAHQSDKWLIRFYRFLLEQASLWRYGVLRQKPFVRTESGSHVAPFGISGSPNVFLPGESPTDLLVVKRSICRDGKAREFFKELGLREPDVVDEVITHVLPKYQSAGGEGLASRYEKDLKKIVRAFSTDSRKRQVELVGKARESYFVACQYANTGVQTFAKPENAYFRKDKLLRFFGGDETIVFVDTSIPILQSKATMSMLEACGVNGTVKRISFDPEFSYEKRRELRREFGDTAITREIELVDYAIEGLDAFLSNLDNLQDCEAVQRDAVLLWDLFCDFVNLQSEKRRHDFSSGTYRWQYYTERSVQFDAHFIVQLRQKAWLPSPQGSLKSPADMCFSELPKSFAPNSSVQSLLEFNPEVFVSLAKEAGIEPGVLNLLKKLGITSEAELRARLGVEDEAALSKDDSNKVNELTPNEALSNLFGGEPPKPTPPISDPAAVDASGSGGGGRGTGTGVRGGGQPGAGHGSGGAKRTPGKDGGRAFVSYVATHPIEDEPDPDGLDHETRVTLENSAISLILSREPQLRRTPTRNPGFDLFEPGADGQPIRWIEVKAMTGSLVDRPVGLSHTQFDCAQEHGEAFWLYVVEKAADAGQARLVRVQDPAGKARTFTFDHGWLHVAEVDADR